MTTGPAVAASGEPLEYHRLHELGRPESWRSPVGVVVLLVWVFVVASLPVSIGFAVYYAAVGDDVGASLTRLADTSHVTPMVLAFVNLTLALAVPGTIVVSRWFNGLGPGLLTSVVGRIRWRWLLISLGLAAITLVVTVAVSAVIPGQGASGSGGSGGLNSFTHTTLEFVLVILVLTPLQATGEEFVFRGYLTQAVGELSLGGEQVRRTLAVVVPAFLFGLAHGLGQSLPIFLDRFAFGLVAGVLVIATGGLEAGIAMHVLNNFLAYGLALAVGDMSTALTPSGESWWGILVTLTQSLVFLGLTVPLARRLGVARTTDGTVLERPRDRV